MDEVDRVNQCVEISTSGYAEKLASIIIKFTNIIPKLSINHNFQT